MTNIIINLYMPKEAYICQIIIIINDVFRLHINMYIIE